MKNDTLVILGSARGDGNTRKIVDHLVEQSHWDQIDLLDYQIGPFDYTHANQHDDFIPLIEDILEKDYKTIVFATPVYWYSMSGVMKDFFDRISDLLKIRKDLGRRLRGRAMGLVICSSNAETYPEFHMPFKRSADYLGMAYLGDVHTWVEEDIIPLAVQLASEKFIEGINRKTAIPFSI